MESNRESDRPETAQSDSASGSSLPRPELNPITNPLLAKNMGRWAQVYFTSPPEKRDEAVEELLRELYREAGGGEIIGRNAAKPATTVATPSENKPAPTPPLTPPSPPVPALRAAIEPSPRTAEPGNGGTENGLTCPACHHKNAAEQRFCGLCGYPLESSAETVAPPIAPATRLAAGPSPAEREPDWQWLRDRSLTHLDSVPSQGPGWKMVAALIGIVAIVILSYIAWTSRSRSSDKTAPTAQVAEPREQSAPPSASFPIPQQTNNADPSAAQRAEKKAARPSASARPIPDSPDAGHAAMRGDGSEELDTARQYLGGGATNKNSRTAAQWLWKSVSKQNEEAVLMLSDLYVRGDGVPHSCEQARVLLVAAAKRGSSAAAQKLRAVEMGCR